MNKSDYKPLHLRWLQRLPRPLKEIARRVNKFGTCQEQWARVVMNRHTRQLVEDLDPPTLNVLEISGDHWGRRVDFHSYRTASFPEFDICKDVLDERFDLILAEQIFEHLLWPYRAGRHVYEMLRPGGHFLITTPFMVRVHLYPEDCTRWTETGLRYFLAECGFDLDRIKTGSWGNRACIKANWSHWKLYRPLFHSLKNEPFFPIVVWALAQKAG